jgi:hypothetical protein
MNLFQVLGGLTPEEEQEIRNEAFAFFPNVAMQEYGGIDTIYTPEGRRDFHGMPVNKYTPQQLEKAMDMASSRSALREGIFRSVLEKTGDLTTAADAATAAEFTPAGTVMGVQDANIAAQEIIPYLKEGDYKSAGLEALNTAMGYGDAALTALPVVGAGYKAVSRMAPTLTSDAIGLGRSVARGDLEGVRDTFTRSRDPRSLGAAGIGDNGGPPLDPVPARASLFSPSLRAAENLKQNKGTYEQMRGMLLKGGGKETELEWSGMDRAFSGQKVTKDDLISYLRKYDPRLEQETVSATVNPNAPQIPAGAVLRSDFDFDDWFENNIMSDAPMVREETNYLVDSLAQDLHYIRDDVAYGPDLDEDQAQALADATGEDVNDLMNAEYIVETGEDSVFLTDDPYDAVMTAYGEEYVDDMVRENLYENYQHRYNYETADFEDQTGLEFYDDPEDFGAQGVMEEGDTRYSAYMPAGFRSYDENFYTYSDPTLQFHDDYIAGASHFGAYDPQTQYHTRVGDYQTTNTVGGQPFNARYVAEIQSDAQQRLRSQDKAPMTYEQGVDLTRNRQTLLPLKNENEIAFQEARDADSEATQALNELKMQQAESGNNKFLIAAKLKRLNRGIQSHRREALRKGPNGTEPFPHFGNNDMPPMDDIVVDWDNVTEAELNRIYRDYRLDKVDAYHADFLETVDDEAVMSSIDAPQDLRERLIAARKKLTEAEKKKASVSEKLHKEEARLDDEFEEKHGAATYDVSKSGPMMASQNRWVDDAIRRSILDAVNDESVDFLAFPKDEQAIGKVGGTDYPKDGTLDFYRRDVQNRLRGIVKKIDKDARIQEIGLESPMRQQMEFPAYGLRLTPEFRRRVKEQGLPTFAAFGAMPLLGVFDYLRDQKEKRNERMGGLMGYGGL